MTIRLFAVAAWWQALPFTGDERAALALAEAVTRLSVAWRRAATPPASPA